MRIGFRLLLLSGFSLLVGLSERSIHADDQEPGLAVEQKPGNDESALAVFQKRILPIFQSKQPTSCTECHLSGVDLKDYIHPEQAKTFASLAEAGLVDVKHPEKSKILDFISRRPKEPTLITEKIRQQEYDAFRAWLVAAVKEPELLAAKPGDKPVGPAVPVEVIRHARSDRVLASFIENIWNEVGRCAACHSPDQNQKQAKEHGERVSWIKLGDPQATLDHMLDAGLIDPSEPEQSLLLKKPTLQLEHGGGKKMVVGDRTYKQFRRFIDDYSSMVAGRYKRADQLPKPADEISVVSDIWLKVTDVPARFDTMLMQVDLYQKEGDGWSKHRCATSDRPVFGKEQLWQHSLSLTALREPHGSSDIRDIRKTRSLPRGKYLVKIYIDEGHKLEKDFHAELGDREFVGALEVESRWPTGYGRMTVVRFPQK